MFPGWTGGRTKNSMKTRKIKPNTLPFHVVLLLLQNIFQLPFLDQFYYTHTFVVLGTDTIS